MRMGEGIKICLLMHSLVMDIKVNIHLSLGKLTQTVMFSITVRSDSMPRSQLRAVQLGAT